MKCDKCNNEATFHYQSNINGEISEYHLCADCAKAEGFGEMMSFRPRSMMRDFFSEPFMGLSDSFFNEPFKSFDRLAESFFGRTALAPFNETAVKIDEPQRNSNFEPYDNATKETEQKRDNIPNKASQELNKRREISALRHQMKAAVIQENFEEAAKIRDQIKELKK